MIDVIFNSHKFVLYFFPIFYMLDTHFTVTSFWQNKAVLFNLPHTQYNCNLDNQAAIVKRVFGVYLEKWCGSILNLWSTHRGFHNAIKSIHWRALLIRMNINLWRQSSLQAIINSHTKPSYYSHCYRIKGSTPPVKLLFDHVGTGTSNMRFGVVS